MDVGAPVDRNDFGISNVFDKVPLTTKYSTDACNVPPPDFLDRLQTIHNVKVDKILEYKDYLTASGKTYEAAAFFGGSSLNCSVGASVALLRSGVLIIPTGFTGLTSFQIFARNTSQYSYFISNHY